MKALGIARQDCWHEFKAIHSFYSLSGRDAEASLITLSQSENLGFLPWSPLAGGFLSGKYTCENEKADGRSRRDEYELERLNQVSETAERYPFWMVDRQGQNRIPDFEEISK